MARNIFTTLKYDAAGTNTFEVAPSDIRIVDVDLSDAFDAQFNVSVTYDATHATTTGVTLDCHYGIGPDDAGTFNFPVPCVLDGVTNPNIVMSDNYDSVTMVTVPTNQGSPVTKVTYFSTNDLASRVPRWLRLYFSNTDASNTATISIIADV